MEVKGRELYRNEYGHYPKGPGTWAFQIGNNPGAWFTRDNTGYGDAVKKAKAEARRCGQAFITVLT